MNLKRIILCFSAFIIVLATYFLVAKSEDNNVYNSEDGSNIIYQTDYLLYKHNINTTNDVTLLQNGIKEIEEENIKEIKTEEFKTKLEELNTTITDKKEWLLKYKDLVNEYSEWVEAPKTIYDAFSSEEIYLMQRCVETETFQHDFNSKCNVASVIFNRLNHSGFPDTVNKVIVPVQFAFSKKNISEDTKLALEYVFLRGDTAQGAIFFHSNSYKPTFCGASYLFTDEAGHHFYIK